LVDLDCVPTDVMAPASGEMPDEEIVARSPVMVSLVRDLESLAAHDRPVFVHGESGAGVGWLCGRIHQTSRRRSGPFVTVHLGALVATHVDETLFGSPHEPGALRSARGGTLLIREFHKLPLDLQWRVLAGGLGHRLVATCYSNGGRTPVRRLSPDVLSRFDAVVGVPPLRARGDDLSELASLLWESIANVHGWTPPPLTGAQLEGLHRHDWPGNVRELRNLLAIAQFRWSKGESLGLSTSG
jgi:two-component system C4-dicarboxylate transport response regulator DctD